MEETRFDWTKLFCRSYQDRVADISVIV